ncbi:hypothetical protein KDC22_07395 [Paenibacillus tritici]|uniref:hypothetical protein n=1 Tax=Paenibacillus tritici TaxID=1873425 RepID=UPI001BA61A6D|nr:hypothetical protein [Paenibacillus tritici]QUL56322.1 hypothetical protein KDC22_07395 [Paenibacillus tritici]
MRIFKISIAAFFIFCYSFSPVFAQANYAYIYNTAGKHLYTSDILNNRFIQYYYDSNGNNVEKRVWGSQSYRDMSSLLLNNTGNFENDSNFDGLADGWITSGQTAKALSPDSRYGLRSQKLQTDNGWGSLKKELGQISSGRHFIALIDYKSNASNTISFRINDNKTDWGINLGCTYFINDNTWRTAHLKFTSTGNPISIIGAYLDAGNNKVMVDGLRLFEITETMYNQIDRVPLLSGNNLSEKFSYGDLLDERGQIDKDDDRNGVADGWAISGHSKATLAGLTMYDGLSQKLVTESNWASIYKEVGSIQSDHYFLALIDYKATSSNQVSLRVNDTQTDWGVNLGAKYFILDNTWRTAYLKFKSTGKPISIIGAYIDPGESMVYLNSLRLFEISETIYRKIDIDPNYTGLKLVNKYPYQSFTER